jgi:hypothetical protein
VISAIIFKLQPRPSLRLTRGALWWFAAIVWSLVEKYVIAKLHMREKLTALSLPAGSTVEDLKQEMSAK